ncbi:MAG: chemotaxis protein CheW [Rhodoferax sp.]|nr:chemotaxis protein CheW [Rhodoferax sp.]OIP20445.1 MAG: chemotaxis protein CheW [Comamonadaceae bacterium CG2_30_57_122]
MANKEALRDLQSRLAERLHAARNEAAAAAWLAVQVGQNGYLLPLGQSGEIFPVAATTAMPYSQPWMLGVVNLRGGLYSVVDLAGFINSAQTAARSEQAWAQARLVTFNPELEINCALVVDALVGLRRQDAFAGVVSMPEGMPDYFGQRLVDVKGVSWQELNLQTLAQNAGFLSVGL